MPFDDPLAKPKETFDSLMAQLGERTRPSGSMPRIRTRSLSTSCVKSRIGSMRSNSA